jgi:hypothetical protein
MKTIATTLAAIAILMFSFQANAGKEANSVTNTASLINYKVIIHIDPQSVSALHNAYVVVTDENGCFVGPAQLLARGKTEYTFCEPGPVSGVRIAKLIKGYRPQPDAVRCADDRIKGEFNNGFVYLLNLYIALPVPEHGGIE